MGVTERHTEQVILENLQPYNPEIHNVTAVEGRDKIRVDIISEETCVIHLSMDILLS